MTIRLEASAPVGAPLAMSTLGAGARSLRAPAMPSIVGRPRAGSNKASWVTGPAPGVPFDQVEPPFVERDMSSNASWPCAETVPTPNTYAVPLLSVRTVQPSVGLRWPLFAAALTWCCSQVVPPSCETATCSGAGAAFPFSWPTNAAQQTYTVPKNGLEEALSAQICSLSEKGVDDWRPMIPGDLQASLPAAPPPAALCGSSVRETAMAS